MKLLRYGPAGQEKPGLLDASGDQELLLTGDASQATAAGITVEPDGGSKQPTTAPIALFDLTQET